MLRLVSIAVVALGLLVGCGAGKRLPATTCDSAYSLSVVHLHVATTCDGLLRRPVVVALLPGKRFVVSQVPESTGKLDYPVLQPSNGAIRLVSEHVPSAVYVAVRAGRAKLVAHHTQYCYRSVHGGCVAFVLSVKKATLMRRDLRSHSTRSARGAPSGQR